MIENQMSIATGVMKRRRNALRELATQSQDRGAKPGVCIMDTGLFMLVVVIGIAIGVGFVGLFTDKSGGG